MSRPFIGFRFSNFEFLFVLASSAFRNDWCRIHHQRCAHAHR